MKSLRFLAWPDSGPPDPGRQAGTPSLSPGQQAEQLAAEYLRRRGLRILARNWRCRHGEIDLIADDGNQVIFVEVRLRRTGQHGDAAASITQAKQRRLLTTASQWLATHGERPCRFDAIVLDRLDMAHLRWIRGAFEAPAP